MVRTAATGHPPATAAHAFGCGASLQCDKLQVAQIISQTSLLFLREWGGMERDNLATLQLLSQAEQPNSALVFWRLLSPCRGRKGR